MVWWFHDGEWDWDTFVCVCVCVLKDNGGVESCVVVVIVAAAAPRGALMEDRWGGRGFCEGMRGCVIGGNRFRETCSSF